MKQINFKDPKIQEKFMEKFIKLPVSPYCPLIKNEKWKCGNVDKGAEKFCKTIQGYTECKHFQKWFWFWVKKYIAEEIARKKMQAKKKVPKKKL